VAELAASFALVEAVAASVPTWDATASVVASPVPPVPLKIPIDCSS
jgi:hypothetical protein